MAEERFQAIEQQLRWIGALFEQNLPILKQQVAALRVDFRALRVDLEAYDLEEENGKPITTLTTEGEGFKSSVLEKETEGDEAAQISQEVIGENEDTKKGPACAFDSNLEGQVVHGSDGSSLVDSIGGFQGFSPATYSREVTNDMLGTDRCSTFNAPRNFLEVSHKKTSVSALSTPILIPPSSPLVSLLLFEFDGISPILDSLLVENNSCASKTKIFEEAEWQGLEGTWLYVYHAEKSNASAVSMGEGQMSCISSGYCMCDVMSGSQLLSTIDSWVHWPTKGANIFCISPIMKGILSWALITQFLPTHLFIIMWYKGELIKMLLDSDFLQGSVDNNLG